MRKNGESLRKVSGNVVVVVLVAVAAAIAVAALSPVGMIVVVQKKRRNESALLNNLWRFNISFQSLFCAIIYIQNNSAFRHAAACNKSMVIY